MSEVRRTATGSIVASASDLAAPAPARPKSTVLVLAGVGGLAVIALAAVAIVALTRKHELPAQQPVVRVVEVPVVRTVQAGNSATTVGPGTAAAAGAPASADAGAGAAEASNSANSANSAGRRANTTGPGRRTQRNTRESDIDSVLMGQPTFR